MANIFKIILTGVSKAISTPTLPENIIKFQSHPLIRLLRVVGGSSIILVLGQVKQIYTIPFLVLCICFFFTLIFTIYHFYISYHRIKHLIYLFKSDKLDVKNSPLDKLASVTVRALMCLKGACEIAQPLGVTLTLMIAGDEIVKSSGRYPIFIPMIGGVINQVIGEGKTLKASTPEIQNYLKNFEKIKIENKELDETLKLLNKAKQENKLSVSDTPELKNAFDQSKQELVQKENKLRNKIIEEIKKIKR